MELKKSKVKVKQKRNIYTYTYTYTHIHMHIHIHIYRYIHTHIHICKLFVICFEIPNTEIPHHMASSQLNLKESQITGFHKMRDTRAGNPRIY